MNPSSAIGYGAAAIACALLATPGFARDPIATSGGPNIEFAGCVYYEHDDFQGDRVNIAAGTNRRYVGDDWNDRISSIACNSYCEITVFEHRDFGGASKAFRGAIIFVGDEWNDRISAARASCSARPSEIRTGADRCLDVHAPDIGNNGGRVQIWSCNGAPQQRWTFDRANGAVRISSGLCLDVHAPDMRNNGGRVQVWACNSQPQQQWTPQGNSVRNAGGLCLDVHAPDQSRDGATVQVWQCNGERQQVFMSPIFQ